MSKKKNPKIELKTFEIGPTDLLAILELEDKPETVVAIAEKIEDGVSQRRMIEFPLDPLHIAKLAQTLMRIADIERISYSRRKDEFDLQFGPKYANEVYRRTV